MTCIYIFITGYPIEEDLFLKAIKAGKYRLVTQILEMEDSAHTLDINQVDSEGQTALLIATQLSNYEIRNNFVKLLCKLHCGFSRSILSFRNGSSGLYF